MKHLVGSFNLSYIRQHVQNSIDTDPQTILKALKVHPILKYHYEPLVDDHMTLEQHTIDTIKLFQQNFAGKEKKLFLSDQCFYVLLAFHAIGKRQAIIEGRNDFHRQYTIKIIDEVIDIIPFTPQIEKQMKLLIDSVENYVDVDFNLTLQNLVSNIKKQHHAFDKTTPLEKIWYTFLVYFQCTMMEFQYLFDTNEKDGLFMYDEEKHRILFSKYIEHKLIKLEKELFKNQR
ncbi:unnamed protein product [Didymodactylos carnosus]|uniref:HD domain-containing protein n=1 Tax=Didymodactylos carnosus TaxID=1234261 RepID=A0A814Q5F9_9BILA|nr:unnamed protein product [Didymodactylos carnosus]CAF1118439.1 unnamed protein product [Didymodactylos carnosus]CAF3878973.1 unnamed protein product [Didymodactylos carnosus]CAF3890469.1 unnamed protein product [Didymodactylos carnosus]